MPYTPIYQPFDLGAFDASLAGESVPILRNPTRAMRREYITSQSDDFAARVAFICDTTAAQLETILAPYDAVLFVWLFVGLVVDGQITLPHVYALWDAYAVERIKKLNGPPASSSAGATDTPASTPANE